MAAKPIIPSTNNTTLDDLLEAAESMYGSYDITDFDVKLRPLLRITKAERDELTTLTETKKDADGNDLPAADYLDVLRAWLMIVADNKVGAEKLIVAIGDRLDAFKILQDRWSEKSQSGEAQPSES